ncbi:hypothetical protein BKA70DRAFT_1443278 [Coprinopsis sp. MPI-PUGE-AT-0042]|nr:hypothetical protein BKA70DRAFT_1443278 [Coprinopsis sp. MPI-PUGE-AT-0042]
MSRNLSQAAKDYEKASRLYGSGGLVDRSRGIEERGICLLNRAEEGFLGSSIVDLWTKRLTSDKQVLL